jgi:hypothetical protein
MDFDKSHGDEMHRVVNDNISDVGGSSIMDSKNKRLEVVIPTLQDVGLRIVRFVLIRKKHFCN